MDPRKRIVAATHAIGGPVRYPWDGPSVYRDDRMLRVSVGTVLGVIAVIYGVGELLALVN